MTCAGEGACQVDNNVRQSTSYVHIRPSIISLYFYMVGCVNFCENKFAENSFSLLGSSVNTTCITQKIDLGSVCHYISKKHCFFSKIDEINKNTYIDCNYIKSNIQSNGLKLVV